MVDKNNQKENGFIIAFFIFFLIIFIPILIMLVSNNIESSKNAKHEKILIQEGRMKTHSDVINEIVEILKNNDKERLKEYLADDFIYYDNENIEHRYSSNFFEDLKIYSASYEIEKRGDTNQDNMATYRIYWNVVEENKNRGIDKTNQYYCLQKITIILKRVVKENVITYEIKKIILTNN